MIDRSHIGRTTEPLVLDVERGHIARFADAIGDPDPIYRDEDAARRAGHPRIPAPPTFATALRPRDVRAGMGITFDRVLHGEQGYELRRPMYAGDRVAVSQRVADIFQKSGKAGVMDMCVFETTGVDPATGEVFFVGRATIVVKR